MFDKNNNIIKIDFQSNKLYKNNDILFTDSFMKMTNFKNYNKDLEEKEIYQDDITRYVNKKYENSIKKQYNPKVVSLYNDGSIIINNTEYPLKEFYIVFNDELNNFTLRCTNSNYQNNEIDYNRSVKFIDTTAFIKLINISEIHDNKIIINDISVLNNIVNNWDGYIHSEVLETDSIINKRIAEVDTNE